MLLWIWVTLEADMVGWADCHAWGVLPGTWDRRPAVGVYVVCSRSIWQTSSHRYAGKSSHIQLLSRFPGRQSCIQQIYNISERRINH